MKNTDRINREYEQKHLLNIKKNQRKINKAYQKAINKIYGGLSLPKSKDTFDITKVPQLNKVVNEALGIWEQEVTAIMVNGVKDAWDLSEVKNDEILKQYTLGKELSPLIKEALFSRNEAAMQAFLKRTSGKDGLDLSQRI